MSVVIMGAVWKLDIAPVPKLVMMALADHANDDGKCWPGRKKIAEKVGVGLVTLDKHIKFLVAQGYLLKEVRYREDGSQSSNHYNINVSQIFPPPALKLDPPQPQGLTQGEPYDLDPHESPYEPSFKSSRGKEKKIFSSEVYRLADLLIELMLKNNPLHRELSKDKRQHSRERYADDIDRLIRIDQRPPPHIEKVIRHSQQDDFWRINVLSAATLRKQWDKLAVKALRFEILKERHNGSGNFSEGNRDDRGPVQDDIHGERAGRNMGKCPF